MEVLYSTFKNPIAHVVLSTYSLPSSTMSHTRTVAHPPENRGIHSVKSMNQMIEDMKSTDPSIAHTAVHYSKHCTSKVASTALHCTALHCIAATTQSSMPLPLQNNQRVHPFLSYQLSSVSSPSKACSSMKASHMPPSRSRHSSLFGCVAARPSFVLPHLPA
ncbi:hypothetical protein BO82DRAFT_50172 [Aspergillus uvarum CBS 121591]|uniref:Uncharacterized protein n=1 Tax=Aspergillus uvarum CBS 121591 TaxID=1448315 RepID=A0A319CB52_9EURO|nr:hypothetical protein BO82DRAFT_50172 [Aspergillus uvarum CBS 121591]PYH83046.1 hypothetical protein BO82DRAFT_50172 [Aspergillus uvarum CBS 121591]